MYGSIALQVALINRTAPLAFQLKSVNHRRIGHQRHIFGQPVLKDAGHQRPLRIHRRLPLDQRSHRHHRCTFSFNPSCADTCPEALHHRARNLRRGCLARETIRVRETDNPPGSLPPDRDRPPVPPASPAASRKFCSCQSPPVPGASQCQRWSSPPGRSPRWCTHHHADARVNLRNGGGMLEPILAGFQGSPFPDAHAGQMQTGCVLRRLTQVAGRCETLKNRAPDRQMSRFGVQTA